jgi:hypothetical protein
MASASSGMKAPNIDTMVDRIGGKVWRTDTSKSGEMTPEKVMEMIRDVSDSDVASTISEVESIKTSDTDHTEFSIFDFIGFDPRVIVKVLRAYQTHYKEGNDHLFSDIRFSIAAVLYMGNLQTKSMTRRALEGKTKIEYLTTKYNIRTGTQGAGIPAEALTFPRIAASFPALAIRMAARLTPSAVSKEFMGRSVPGFMRLTPFASLCSPKMDSRLRTYLLEVCNAHGSDMALAYEEGRCKKLKKKSELTAKVAAEDQWAFMEIASESPVPVEPVKKTMLTELNLVSHFDAISQVNYNYRLKLNDNDATRVSILSKADFEKMLSEYIMSPESSIP